MVRRCLVVLAVAGLMSGVLAQGGEWPVRPINIVVGFGAGGTTDLVARALAEYLTQELGVRVTVTNMAGASGGIAAEHVWTSARDGYTILGTPDVMRAQAVMDSHPTTAINDWQPFIAAAFDGVISVRRGSPYESFDELVAAVRDRPNTITLAASSAGTAWHIQSELLRQETGIEFRFVAYPGSHPAQVAAMAGDVEVAWTAVGEQRDLLRSGDLRPLALFSAEGREIEGAGFVPPITDFVPEIAPFMPFPSWIGIAVPQDTPDHIKSRIESAYLAAVNTPEFRQTIEDTLSGSLLGYDAAESLDFVRNQTSLVSWLLHNIGLAVKSPEAVGIPRP